MPAQRRSSNLQQGDEEDSRQHRPRRKQSRRSSVAHQATSSRRPPVGPPQQEDQLEEQQQEDQRSAGDQDSDQQIPQEDSDGSGTDPEDFDEVVTVLRSDLRNNVQCPICLGIIKKTRTVMGCLHRFCRECIDKSMRLGNNECPACRIHCASRRSLRDDLDFDALINAIYPDVEKYEEEELVFLEEEKTRNKQIQASIAQISKRQLEALNKRRKLGKDADDMSPARVPRTVRNPYTRRRNLRADVEGDDVKENDNDQDANENPSPAANHETEIRPRRRKRRTLTQPSTRSPSAADPDGVENSTIAIRDENGSPIGPIHNPETLTWGRGGARSHTRYGIASGSRGNKGNRLSKLIEHLESVGHSRTESNVHLSLISLDKEKLPNLEKPYLCCPSSMSVEHLREHVAEETNSEAVDVEMLSVERIEATGSTVNFSNLSGAPNQLSRVLNWPNVRFQALEGRETLAGFSCSSNNGEIILAYGQKKETSQIL